MFVTNAQDCLSQVVVHNCIYGGYSAAPSIGCVNFISRYCCLKTNFGRFGGWCSFIGHDLFCFTPVSGLSSPLDLLPPKWRLQVLYDIWVVYMDIVLTMIVAGGQGCARTLMQGCYSQRP